MSGTTDWHSTKLAKGFTVADYQVAKRVCDRKRIAQAISNRFTERYLLPASSDPKNGFAMMAIGCLMVEALASFKEGLNDSNRKSEKLFVAFFQEAPQFVAFRDVGRDFYRCVRCGILHQAETTGGWRILRRGPLYDRDRTINAASFIMALRMVLHAYCDRLNAEPWDSDAWIKARRKMDHICMNCVGPTNDSG